jgi:hypothetical protein
VNGRQVPWVPLAYGPYVARLKIGWHGGPEGERPLCADGMTQTVPGFDRLTVDAGKLGGQRCIRVTGSRRSSCWACWLTG